MTNKGVLNNNGIVDNAGTGTIVNEGAIDNAKGTINNTAGGTFRSVQTKEEMGGIINGPVETIGGGSDDPDDPDNPDETPSVNDNGGNSGCNAGSGLLGLLPLAVWVARKRIFVCGGKSAWVWRNKPNQPPIGNVASNTNGGCERTRQN